MRKGRVQRIVWAVAAAALLSAIAFMVVRIRGYAFATVPSVYNPQSLAESRPTVYYIDWSGDYPDANALRAGMASDGIAISRHDLMVEGRRIHDPIKVIQTALGLLDQIRKRPTPEAEAAFRRHLDWVVTNAAFLPDSTPVWIEVYTNPRHGLHTRWVSALAQGQAISLLIRASDFTGDPRYLRLARHVVRGFIDPGLPIVWHGPDGEVFLEEYPCAPPAHVLNGGLLAWLGLWDYVRATGDPEVRAFCLRSIDTVKELLPRYSVLDDWTRYDLLQDRPASPMYQALHAALAEALHGIFPEDPLWADRAERWRRGADSPVLRLRASFGVLAFKLRSTLTGGAFVPKGILFGEGDRIQAGKEGPRQGGQESRGEAQPRR